MNLEGAQRLANTELALRDGRNNGSSTLVSTLLGS
jgi:hypothetical protein